MLPSAPMYCSASRREQPLSSTTRLARRTGSGMGRAVGDGLQCTGQRGMQGSGLVRKLIGHRRIQARCSRLTISMKTHPAN